MNSKRDMKIKRVSRMAFSDNRGTLLPFNLRDKPFNKFNRIFCTADLKMGEARGFHAHREQTQLLFVIQGEFNITYENSSEKGDVLIDNKSDGVEIPKMTWSTQTPTKNDSVLLVFASGEYDEKEYIRNYEEFILLSNKNGTK